MAKSGKKGMSKFALLLYMILFYLPMTLIVYFLLIKVPNNILDARIYVGELPNTFLLDRLHSRVSYTDLNTGRVHQGVIEDKALFNESLIADMFYFHPDKPIAFNLTMESNKSLVFNPAYYEIAYPLAPIRYGLLISQKEFIVLKDKNITNINFKLVSAKKLR